MQTTSTKWKENQKAQIRAKSLIKVNFISVENASVSSYSHTGEEGYFTPESAYLKIGETGAINYSEICSAFELSTVNTDRNTDITISVSFYLGASLVLTKSIYQGEIFILDEIKFNRVMITSSSTVFPDSYISLGFSARKGESINNDDIVKLTCNSSISVINKDIQKGEVVIEVDNSNKKYDIYNPNSDYYKLQKRMPIHIYYGYQYSDGTTEYVNGGYYFLSSWSNDTSGITFQMTFENTLSFLNEVFYYQYLTRRVKRILLPDHSYTNVVSLKNNPYSAEIEMLISTSKINQVLPFTSLNAPTYKSKVMLATSGELLQNVALTCARTLYLDKSNYINFISSKTDFSTVDYTIDKNNTYSEPLSTFEEKYSAIYIRYSQYDLDAGKTLEQELPITKDGETYKIKTGFINTNDSKPFYRSENETKSLGYVKYTTDNTNWTTVDYDYYQYAYLKSNAATYITVDEEVLQAYGVGMTVEKKDIKEQIYNDTTIDANELVVEAPLYLGVSYENEVGYQDKVQSFVSTWANRNQVIECDIRLDPALDLLDIVELGDLGIKGIVESIELTFDGAYKGIVKIRRVS